MTPRDVLVDDTDCRVHQRVGDVEAMAVQTAVPLRILVMTLNKFQCRSQTLILQEANSTFQRGSKIENL